MGAGAGGWHDVGGPVDARVDAGRRTGRRVAVSRLLESCGVRTVRAAGRGPTVAWPGLARPPPPPLPLPLLLLLLARLWPSSASASTVLARRGEDAIVVADQCLPPPLTLVVRTAYTRPAVAQLRPGRSDQRRASSTVRGRGRVPPANVADARARTHTRHRCGQ